MTFRYNSRQEEADVGSGTGSAEHNKKQWGGEKGNIHI
jgi:hypothetical protein